MKEKETKDEKRLKEVIARNNKIPIIPPPENPHAPYSTVLDTIINFFDNTKIDFKKDDTGIHLKIDKDQNK